MRKLKALIKNLKKKFDLSKNPMTRLSIREANY